MTTLATKYRERTAGHPTLRTLAKVAGPAGVATGQRLSVALTLLRVVAGIVFIAHGAQKLFTFGLAGLTEVFAGMGVPLAGLTAPAVAFLEFFGGMALLAGLFTPVVASLLAVVMLGALVFAHLPAGFFLPDGYEFVLTLFAVNVALVLAGPGPYSLDAVLARRARRES